MIRCVRIRSALKERRSMAPDPTLAHVVDEHQGAQMPYVTPLTVTAGEAG
jgi:hypothetical protein